MIKVNIWNKNPLCIEVVLYELRTGGMKMIIGNSDKLISQISWAPNDLIEIVTLKNGKKFNHFFYKFEEMKTIEWIHKTYPTDKFYYGYFED